MKLTPQQKIIYDFMQNHPDDEFTAREIAERTEAGTKAGVKHNLNKLRDKGLVISNNGYWRPR